jgi:maltose/moltooligosaccharide transporter
MAANENGIPVTTMIAFIIGSVVSIGSILWALKTTKEMPMTEEEKAEIRQSPVGVASTFKDIWEAIKKCL